MKKVLFLALLAFLPLLHDVSAQIPRTMSYQGVLTNGDGSPVADGNTSVTFRLYDVAIQGTQLWQETQDVTTNNGLFNVILGTTAPINLPFDKQYWLGISLDSGEELTPRIALTSSPYALNSTATVIEPQPGQSFTIRDANGNSSHVLSQDGDVLHKGTGTFEGGLKVTAATDSGLVLSESNGFVFIGADTLTPLSSKEQVETNSSRPPIARTRLLVTRLVTPLLQTNRIVADNNGGITVIEADAKDFGTAVEGKTKDGDGVVGEATGSGDGVTGISRGDGEAIIGTAFGSGDAVVGTAIGAGTGVTGSGNTSYGGWFQSTSGIGLFSRGSTTAGKFEGDVLIERQGKLKIDNVPAENSDQFLVWGADKFVKLRSLPAVGGFDGTLVDKPFYLINANGDTVFSVGTDGQSVHTGEETFIGGIKVPLRGLDGSVTGHVVIDGDGLALELADGKPLLDLTTLNGLRIYENDGTTLSSIINNRFSSHFAEETFFGGIKAPLTDSTGAATGTAVVDKDGFAVKDKDGRTISGLGRFDLDTMQRIGVFGKAEKPGDLAAAFEGPVDVLGEITASSLHIVNTNGDTLTNFNADGTSFHKGKESFAGGIAIVNSDGSTAIDLQPNTDPNTQYALTINGNIMVNGMLQAEVKNFKIDHPLDPENKYLTHTSVESPDMKTVYDGVVVLDENGEAQVEMPDWFEALNGDFRYQLTCVGGFAQVYIAEEIQNNQFKIAGGSPGMKVSWQVTGIRHDTWAKEHRQPVETYK